MPRFARKFMRKDTEPLPRNKIAALVPRMREAHSMPDPGKSLASRVAFRWFHEPNAPRRIGSGSMICGCFNKTNFTKNYLENFRICADPLLRKEEFGLQAIAARQQITP